MANVLSKEKIEIIVAGLKDGQGIRQLERATGVHRDTIMRLRPGSGPQLSIPLRAGECEIFTTAATAFGRRKRAWLDNGQSIARNCVIDCTCGNSHCGALAHAFQREKIDTRTASKIWDWALPSLLELAEGCTIGIQPQPWHNNEKAAIQLRQLLYRSAMMTRWALRIRSDGIWVVSRIGKWGSVWEGTEQEDYELFVQEPHHKPTKCACGCNETVTLGAFVEGHMSNAKKYRICPGCGNPFEGTRMFCTAVCRKRIQALRKALGYTGAQKKATAYAY